MMCYKIKFLGMLLGFLVLSQSVKAEESVPMVETEDRTLKSPVSNKVVAPKSAPKIALKKSEISDGSDVYVEEKGVGITPPMGWMVNYSYPNTTLLIEAPEDPRLRYRRTIQILSFAGAKVVDEMTAEEFDKNIIEHYSAGSHLISQYRITNHLPVELDSKVNGYLFYAKFILDETEMMQMHILVSSKSRHYLMTFTDMAEYFDTDAANDDHLNQAWQTLGTVRLDGVGPTRFEVPKNILISVICLLVLFTIYMFFRNRRAERKYDNFADGNYVPDEGDEEDLALTIGPQSVTPRLPQDSVHIESLHHSRLASDDDDDYLADNEDIDFDEDRDKAI